MYPLRFCITTGLLWTAKVSLSLAFSILKGLRIYLFAQITTRNNFCIKYGGRWAVVTGASEGIGRAFACEVMISLVVTFEIMLWCSNQYPLCLWFEFNIIVDTLNSR